MVQCVTDARAVCPEDACLRRDATPPFRQRSCNTAMEPQDFLEREVIVYRRTVGGRSDASLQTHASDPGTAPRRALGYGFGRCGGMELASPRLRK